MQEAPLNGERIIEIEIERLQDFKKTPFKIREDMEMDPQSVIRQFERIYGPGKGTQMYLTVMPGILADFQKMIANADPGQTVPAPSGTGR